MTEGGGGGGSAAGGEREKKAGGGQKERGSGGGSGRRGGGKGKKDDGSGSKDGQPPSTDVPGTPKASAGRDPARKDDEKRGRGSRSGKGEKKPPQPPPLTEEKKAAIEEERRRKAEEEAERKRKAEEEERVRKQMEAQILAMQQVEDMRRAEEARRAMRESNSPAAVSASREAREQARLKSDLKRITGLKVRVRSLTEDSKDTVLRDVASLNLEMFIEELVAAVVESKLKASDILAAIQVCSALHARYEAFTSGLIPSLTSVLHSAPATGEEDKETARKKRQALRLLLELYLFGVHSELPLLIKTLRAIAPPQSAPDEAGEGGGGGQALRFRRSPAGEVGGAIDVSLLVTFVKVGGEDLLGILSRKHRGVYEAAGVDPETRLKPDYPVTEQQRRAMRNLAEGAFDVLSRQLEAAHKSLRAQEKRAEKDRLMYGSLTEDKEKALEDAKKAYEKLLTAMQSLSDGLDRDLPELPEEDKAEAAGKSSLSMWDGDMGAGGAALGPFDDEETRAFYEELPDLLAMLPPTLLGLTEEEAEKLRLENSGKKNTQAEEEAAAMEAGLMDVSAEEGGDAMDVVEGEEEEEEEEGDEEEDDEEEEDEAQGEGGSKSGEASTSEPAEPDTPAHHQLSMLLHEALPLCYNRDRADDFCLRFCHHNSKSARRRLATALFEVPRQSLDLLPQYARIAATLDLVMKDLVPQLLAALQDEFRYFQRKKPSSHLEAKVKNVKYIGELVKFKVCPPIVPFTVLKTCLDKFTPHNVEVACALLEACGRYLFRTAHTHDRLVHYLDVMLRLKKVRRLDPTYETLIENAYYICNPPERVVRKVKQLTPLQAYIRHLLLERLDEDSVEVVIKQLRKLPWADPEAGVEDYVITCAMLACQGHYDSVHLVADVLAGLYRWRDALVVQLVDRVIEILTRSMEAGKERDPQSHLALVKLLGELYNYELVSNPVIFNTLHFFIDYGHEVPDTYKLPQVNPAGGPPLPPLVPSYVTHDPRVPSTIDPPADTYRAQLVCKLLQTTGSYFVAGKVKSRLDVFLTYFQRYLFCRGYVPPDTEYEVLDLLDELEAGVRAAAERKAAKAAATTQQQQPGGGGRGKKGAAQEPAAPAAADALIPRFNSFEEAQAAVEVIERETLGAARAGEKKPQEEEDEEEEEEEEEEDDGEEDDGDEERTLSQSEREDDDDEDDEDDTDEEGGLEDDDEEEEVVRRGAVVKTEEDLELEREFEKAFAATVMKSVDERKSTARVSVADNMLLPATLPKILGRAGAGDEGGDENEEGGGEAPKSLAGTPGIKFCMLKRGQKGRLEARELVVPAYTSMAAQIRSHRDAEREEQNVLKQRVLQYETHRMDQEMDEDEEAELAPMPPKVYNAPLSEQDLAFASGRGRGGYRGGGGGGYRGRGGSSFYGGGGGGGRGRR